MMCELSVVIVSWNAREYLLGAVDSILTTARRHGVEIIVVDNASGDGSPEAVAARFPDVTLIRNPTNLGFARANNIGIRAGHGRLVALVNSDVTVLPECLDTLIDFMDAHPRAGMAGPLVLNTDGTVQHSHWDFPSRGGALARTLALDTLVKRGARSAERGEGALARMLGLDTLRLKLAKEPAAPAASTGTVTTSAANDGAAVEVLSGCFMVLRRTALEEVGLLDEDFYIYGEDMDLCRRFHAAGWEVHHVAAARAIHAGGASSANAPVRFFLELQKANLHYWTKHHGRGGRRFFLANTFIHHLLRLVPRVMMYVLYPPRRILTSQKIKRSAACMKWILGHARSQ